MSVDRHLCIGPYARCTFRNETEIVKERACPTHGPARKKRGPHCQLCGAAFVDIPKAVPKHLYPHHVIDDDRLCDHVDDDGETIYLFPNGARDQPDYGDTDDEFHVDSANFAIAADIAWFEREYADELVKLRAAYDGLEVRWGVHQWFS